MANVKRPPFFVTPTGPEPTTGGNLSRRSPALRGAIASGKWLAGMLTVVLPMCPFIVGLQMSVATFAKSFKEAQGDLSLLMMVQMIPGFLTTLYPMASKTWMHFVAWVGQQALITAVLGGKAPSMLFFVAAALNLVIAAVTSQGTAALLHREKIIFVR